MKNCNRTFWLGLFLLMSSGCNPLGSEKFKVEFKNSGAFKDLKTQVVNVSIANNQLVISGSSLSGIKTATLKNVSQEEVFQVESATESQIIANGARAISIAAGSMFDLILADAYGASTFQVTFSVADGAITTTKIANGAVTAAKLDSMGASAGQYLKYNGSSWVAASLIDGQTYLGTWNATTNAPDLTLPSSLAGDYYVVTVAGTFNGIAYAVGDWIISDGYGWQKIPYSKTSVASFQGRKGVVTLVPGDYVSLKDTVTSKVTGSSLNDIADIDLTTIAPISGSVLKYNGSKWVAGTDNTGVASGSIVDADVSATANIAQSKISGLTGSLSGKQDTSTLASDVRAIPLTGLTSASGSVAATDTILGAFGKLMNTQSDYVSKSTGAAITTGTIAVSGTGMITIPTATGVTATEAANVTYVNNAISANGVWNKSGSTINYTAGNVGVGTTTPNAPLHVKTSNDGTYGGSLIENLNSAQYAGFSAKNDVGNTIQLGIYGSTNSSANKAFLYAGASTGSLGFFINSAEKMTLLQNGNVGIGTSAPGAKLEISGSAWSDADGGDFRVTNSGTVGSSVTIKSTTTGGHSYSLLSTGTGAIQGAGSFAIFDNTVPAYRLYINGSGNIGIGTTTPATNLEVAGALRLSTTGTDSFTTPTGSSVPTKINIPYFNPGAFGQILIAGLPSVAPSSARAMTFVDARTVAHQPTVAVLSPNENQIMGLSFDGSNTSAYLKTTSSDLGLIVNNSTDALHIVSSGNVGVGTTTPSTTLQVAGEISPSADNAHPLGDATHRFTAVYAVNGAIQTSDAREKRNIRESDLGLEFLNKLRPVSYYWKSGADKDLHYGLIAQETEKVLKGSFKNKSVPIVDHDVLKDKYGIRYTELISPIIKAVQELYSSLASIATEATQVNERVAKLEVENSAKDKEIAELKARLSRIENVLNKK